MEAVVNVHSRMSPHVLYIIFVADYPVSIFDGGKRFIAAKYDKTSPRSEQLGILYLVFGSVLLCSSITMVISVVRHTAFLQATRVFAAGSH